MAKVVITEYASMKLVEGFGRAQIPDEESRIAVQTIDCTAGEAKSAALNASTNFVRIHTDAIVGLDYGAAPTATTDSERWAANQTEYRGVKGVLGKKYSAIIRT